MSLHSIVLAAGKGTRLKSARSKMLIPLEGRPLVSHAVATAASMPGSEVVVVVGHQAAEVKAALRSALPDARIRFATQREQRGTGDAVAAGLRAVRGAAGSVLVLSGDVPLISRATLTRLRRARERAGADLALLSMEPPDPGHYGRVVRNGERVTAVVEFLDAGAETRALREVNAGVYCLELSFLRRALKRLRADNAKGEVYLTDLVAAAAEGRGALALRVPPDEVRGVNTWAEQATLEGILRTRAIARLMDDGVQVMAPDRLIVHGGVRVAAGCCLGADVALTGQTRLSEGCTVEQGAILHDCTVGAGTRIRPYCVLEGVAIPSEADVGPYVHLSASEHDRLPEPIHPVRPPVGRATRRARRGRRVGTRKDG